MDFACSPRVTFGNTFRIRVRAWVGADGARVGQPLDRGNEGLQAGIDVSQRGSAAVQPTIRKSAAASEGCGLPPSDAKATAGASPLPSGS